MAEGTKLLCLLLFAGGALLFAAAWWLFHRIFGVPQPDPTSSPPASVDPTFLSWYGGRNDHHGGPGTGGSA